MPEQRRHSDPDYHEAPGPIMGAYIETRLALLTQMVVDKCQVRDDALAETAASIRAALQAVKDAGAAAQAASDIRYQQRFEAQSDALAAAFLSQQTAMKIAFEVAEKAVSAALAAADRAVLKSEAAADKRFEALMDGLGPRFDALSAASAAGLDALSGRVVLLEGSVSKTDGAVIGSRHVREDSRATWAIVVAVGAMLVQIAVWLFRARA